MPSWASAITGDSCRLATWFVAICAFCGGGTLDAQNAPIKTSAKQRMKEYYIKGIATHHGLRVMPIYLAMLWGRVE
jgi:hypothetical protein